MINKVNIKSEYSTGNHYLYATRDIKAKEEVLFVPEHLVFDEPRIGENPIVKQILNRSIREDDIYKEGVRVIRFKNEQEVLRVNALYSVFLIAERKRDTLSNLQTWLNLMPKSFNHFPAFFKKNE